MTASLGPSRWLFALARRALRLVVRLRALPDDPALLGIDRSRPVCYALHLRQLPALLVLDEAARALGLPLPSAPLAAEGIAERSSFFFLTRSGQPSPLRRNPYQYSRRLERLVAAVRREPALDVQIVPVSVFWGRAPRRDDSIVSALFSDGWAAPGALGQLLRLLVNGRRTQVSFGTPFSLREAIAPVAAPAALTDAAAAGRDPATRRVARLLRATFRRERELAIGPNLSHRQTLVNEVILGPEVQRAIGEEAARRGEDTARVELRARRFACEIASDYSYPFVRVYERALEAFWNRVYDGIDVHRFDEVAQAGAGAEIVYVPCHRSHADYLVLSYVIHRRGLSPPHVAAGINLDFPLVGPMLRKGGAFFLRRSLRGEPLFAAVFREYLHEILRRGHPIEYFVEGGRSRSGRMLPPRSGLLAMTLDSYLRDPGRPIVFVPVWIGYEQLLEGDSYAAELAGAPKRRETLTGLLRALRELRRHHYGRVHLNVGEAARLDQILDAQWPGWRSDALAGAPAQCVPADSQAQGDEGAQSAGSAHRRQPAVRALARTIVERINDAAVVNPVNLLATALVGAPRPAIDAGLLAARIELLRALLRARPPSPRTTLTPMDGWEVIRYAHRQRIVERIDDPLGEIVRVAPLQAQRLGYFANNVLHVFALPSLIACIVSRHPRIGNARLHEVAARLGPFIAAELHFDWQPHSLGARVDALLAELARQGLLRESDGRWQSPAPGRLESALLEGLARVIRATLERHLLVLRTLAGAGSGALSRDALLSHCLAVARRAALLNEGTGPDFADAGAFASLLGALLETGLIVERADLLEFDDALLRAEREADALLPAQVALAIPGQAGTANAGAGHGGGTPGAAPGA